VLVDHAHQASPKEKHAVGDPQRLSDNEQLEILALLEAVSTERSAMRAARALAELMGHLHGLGQRIAGELPDQNRDIKPARR
jgi:DNA repair protein RadC